MSVCIQYSRPASGSADSEIFGFDVAVTSFLKAWFRYGSQTQFVCRPTDFPSFDHFKALATEAGHDAEARCIGLDPRTPQHNLGGIDCIFRPDPLIADLAWRRVQVPPPGFATCGLVHTMSGERIARAVGELITAPTDGTDALICPSKAIRDAVRTMWEIQADYLNFRFKGSISCPVQTPIIPLGIDTDKFTRATADGKRAAQRVALGVADDEIVVLFVGRLSFATKAHPLPLFLAAERAAKDSGKKLRLVMLGYFKPADMEPHFRNLARDICRAARVEFVANDDARFPDGLWAGADMFVSLSDNVQESFGLTPIEAMAAGLPAIVTDWDGYREGVRDGVDGFLIPTFMPPATAGQAIATEYYNNDNYGVSLAASSQSTGIDIAAAAAAIARLATNADLRRRMGESGRARARSIFDWRVVIAAYEALWTELGAQRKARPVSPAVAPDWQAAHPSYINPYVMFGGFPTRTLSPQDVLRCIMSAEEIAAIQAHEMNFFVPDLLLPKHELLELAAVIRRAGRARIGDILSAFPPASHDLLWRCLGWLMKHGVCVLDK